MRRLCFYARAAGAPLFGIFTGYPRRYLFAKRFSPCYYICMKQRIRALTQLPALKLILRFCEGPFFPAAYAVLVLLSSFFGLEIAFMAAAALIVVFLCVFSRDTRPMLCVVFMTVYAASWKHTPQPPFSSDFFNLTWVRVCLVVFGVLVVAAMLFRFIVFPQDRNFFKESKLRLGIVLMTAAFLLNGVFSDGYVIKDLPFGLLMALSFFIFYIFFFNTMRTDEDTAPYAAYILVLTSAVIFLQLCKIFIFDGVIKDGSIDKDVLIAGWGMSNNIGGMLGMFFPACFYLAYRARRFGWVYYLLAFVFFFGVCLTLSRTSVLVSGVIFVAAAILLMAAKSPVRKFVRIFNAVAAVAGIVALAVLWDKVREVFAVFFERGFSDSGRFDIWESGLRNFLRAPVFGVGFYEPIMPDWSYEIENWIFPDMYHNIFVQMLASCGVVGAVALCVHLAQVVFAVKKRPCGESLFYIAVLLGMLGMSMLDNHLFHVFPAAAYSVFLLLSEREGESGPLLLLRPIPVKSKKEERPAPADGAAAAEGGNSA